MKPQFLHKTLLFVCFCLAAMRLAGQGNPSLQPIFSAYEAKITTTHFINDLYLDRFGLLWMATDQGVIKWDGLHQTFFDDRSVRGKFQLQGEKIAKILEDENRNLILVDEGSPPGFEQLDLISEIPRPIAVNSMETGQEVVVEFCSVAGKGIFLAIAGKTAVYFYQFLPTGDFVLLGEQSLDFDVTKLRKRYATNGEEHWLAVEERGVWRWKEGDWEMALDLSNEEVPHPAWPRIFHCDHQGHLWLSLRNQLGLWQATADDLKMTTIETPFSNALNHIKEDEQGNVLFLAGQYPAPLKEIRAWNNGQWTDFSWITDSYPNATSIYAKDFRERIFVTAPNSVYLIRQEKPVVKQYLRRELQADEFGTIIKGINEGEDGKMYFLSENNFLFRYDPKEQEELQPQLDTLRIREPESNRIFDFNCGGELIKDQRGYFWFKICSTESYRGILVRFDPRKEAYRFFPHPENFRSLDLEPGKGIWVGHHDQKNIGQISFFDFAEERYIPLDELGLSCRFSIPKYLLRGQDSILWVGTNNGLGKIDLRKSIFNLYTTDNSQLPDNHIITIYQKTKDELLLGTYGGGLVIFHPTDLSMKVFSEADGLPNNNVCGIIPSGEQHYWLSTFDGLSYFNTQQNFFTNYTTSSGFNYHEFNRYAFYKSRTGENYFGNINGANSFREADLLRNNQDNNTGIASLRIYYGANDSLQVQEKGLRTIKHISLPHNFTYLQLDLYHTGYLQKEGQQILTRLLGYDSDWEVSDPTKPLRYRNLRTGTYPLYLKADQDESSATAAEPILVLEVHPPIYQTWWFILGLGSLIFGFLWYWNRQRIERIKKEEAERSANNLKFAELELQALQSQLNPHFIFNSLGAIQYFIKTNEKEKADGYLTSFARLMRLFLESSKNKYITLSEEIEMLRLYIELESLRFKESFTANITIDPDLDPAQIYLPSLLLQPFIENAINHGLFHKEERGHLSLDFSPMENDGLLVTLEDNGIGRAKAREIKKRSVLNYKSRAMQIIDERREVLSKVEDYHIDIQIIDLTFPDDVAAGTKVIIKVPEIE